jgi:endonuclease III
MCSLASAAAYSLFGCIQSNKSVARACVRLKAHVCMRRVPMMTNKNTSALTHVFSVLVATVMSTRLSRSRSNSIVSSASIEEYNSTAAAVMAEANSREELRLQEAAGDASVSPSKAVNIEIEDNVGLVN